jgi:hypothetical protein
MPDYLADSKIDLAQTRLWGYVGKTWIECERRRMSPINRLTTTKDSKNLFYMGKKTWRISRVQNLSFVFSRAARTQFRRSG